MDAANPLAQFIDRLIDETEGESLSGEDRTQLHQGLLTRLTKWITLKTMTELSNKSPQHVAELQKMTEKNASDEEIQSFVASHIDNPDAFLTATLLDFRSTYLGVV